MTIALDPIILTVDEIERAQASMSPPSPTPAVGGRVEAAAEPNRLPVDAVRLVGRLLDRLAAGQIVTLVPAHAELTLAEAAELLSVSPPFVAKLIDEGELPCPTHRRVLFSDVMAYKHRNTADREKALAELTQLSQDLGLY